MEEEKVHHHKYIVRRRASSRTHVTKNRTIDGLEERANARCGRLRVEGARLLFACCCFSCVFAMGVFEIVRVGDESSSPVPDDASDVTCAAPFVPSLILRFVVGVDFLAD